MPRGRAVGGGRHRRAGRVDQGRRGVAIGVPTPAVSHERVITAEQRAFWAFRPLATQPPPAVRRATGRAPTSVYLARLEQDGLSPVGTADKLTLLRRATFDLTGLPPAPDDVDAFLKDESPDAYAKVIDRLLASPQYGEAWGRIWLDVARYGEDDYRSLDPMGRGFNPYPNAHLYRDWVIRAFNDDLPYDQFVTAQLAADLLGGGALASLPALRVPRPRRGSPATALLNRARRRAAHASVIARHAGLTVAARCHVTCDDTNQGLLLLWRLPQHRMHGPVAPKVVEDQGAREAPIRSGMLGEYTNTEGATAARRIPGGKHAGRVANDRRAEEGQAEVIEKEKPATISIAGCASAQTTYYPT